MKKSKVIPVYVEFYDHQSDASWQDKPEQTIKPEINTTFNYCRKHGERKQRKWQEQEKCPVCWLDKKIEEKKLSKKT